MLSWLKWIYFDSSAFFMDPNVVNKNCVNIVGWFDVFDVKKFVWQLERAAHVTCTELNAPSAGSLHFFIVATTITSDRKHTKSRRERENMKKKVWYRSRVVRIRKINALPSKLSTNEVIRVKKDTSDQKKKSCACFQVKNPINLPIAIERRQFASWFHCCPTKKKKKFKFKLGAFYKQSDAKWYISKLKGNYLQQFFFLFSFI